MEHRHLQILAYSISVLVINSPNSTFNMFITVELILLGPIRDDCGSASNTYIKAVWDLRKFVHGAQITVSSRMC